MYVECDSMGLHGHRDVHDRYVYTYLRIYFIFRERERELVDAWHELEQWYGDRRQNCVCCLQPEFQQNRETTSFPNHLWWFLEESYCWWFGNPEPVDKQFIPLFTRFYTSLVVVGDFWTINSSSYMLFCGESNYHCLMMGLFCSMRFRLIPFPGSDFMICVVGGVCWFCGNLTK